MKRQTSSEKAQATVQENLKWLNLNYPGLEGEKRLEIAVQMAIVASNYELEASVSGLWGAVDTLRNYMRNVPDSLSTIGSAIYEVGETLQSSHL